MLNMASSHDLLIANPKRGAAPQKGRDSWFPYYAGFSSEFARQIVESNSLGKGAMVMDPWNGSGTTTFSAVTNGYKAVGFDLNPVMPVVAKARLLPNSEISSISALLSDLLKKAALSKRDLPQDDPLRIWLAPDAATAVRRLERALYTLLISPIDDRMAVFSVEEISCIAAFFYVALFRTVRSLLGGFKGSNPTWVLRPRSSSARLRPNKMTIRERFASSVTGMLSESRGAAMSWAARQADFMIGLASSDNLPVLSETIDFVLSSPPYCTRIDYGIATSIELAVLGFSFDGGLRELRNALIGTPTIHGETPDANASWGDTCLSLLERIRNHPSKAAETYYYKTYVQYFAAMSRSLSELGRCLKPKAICVLVVQDSYFKDVHIDLARAFAEMAPSALLRLRRQVDFPIGRTFGSVNSRSRNYRNTSSATESVLCFVKSH